MQLDSLDHLVLTVQDVAVSCEFYTRVLGMREETFGDGRLALAFGTQKINLHQLGREFEPKAQRPTAGSADLCFLTTLPLAQVMVHLQACQVEIEQGPIQRTGAQGPIMSIYIRDPDRNLIEISNRMV